MRLIVYSKGLYSTWLYYAPDRLAFDAGEGLSSILGNKCFAIQHVFLSHGHADHISGLIGLINIRNSGMGDTEKPLTIYYPPTAEGRVPRPAPGGDPAAGAGAGAGGDHDDLEGTETLFHEATFLNPEDRESKTHSTLDEALEVARRAGVKRELFVFHISSRYKPELPKFEEKLRQLELGFRVVLVPPGRVCRYD